MWLMNELDGSRHLREQGVGKYDQAYYSSKEKQKFSNSFDNFYQETEDTESTIMPHTLLYMYYPLIA